MPRDNIARAQKVKSNNAVEEMRNFDEEMTIEFCPRVLLEVPEYTVANIHRVDWEKR